jgi:hypothetical protein
MKKTMKRIVLVLSSMMAGGSLFAASPQIDLSTLFDTDVFLESGGVGLGTGLDANGDRVDSTTLPANYVDGVPIATQDGRTIFKFGNLKGSSTLDGVLINGQTISVPPGNYSSLDFALLDAPNGFGWPFNTITFNYADGSKDTNRFGPVPGWTASPNAFDHAILNATDNSAVTTYASFPTTGGEDEAPYIYYDQSNGVDSSRRFVDANNYIVYRIPVSTDIKKATLGITVGNDFVVSVATSFTPDNDPANFEFRTNGWTLLANSSVIYGHAEHNLANLKEYTFDASALLAEGTGEIYILFTDATPNDGWGPYMQQIRLYTGTPVYFSERLDPAVNTSGATVYAMFDVGTTNETPYLYDNSASGPTGRGYRYADGNGSVTYKFTFPTNTTNAKLTMDLANNFLVSMHGSTDPVVTYASFIPTTDSETNFLFDADSSNGSDPGHRFMDANSYVIYQFTLPVEVTNAIAHMKLGNGYLVQMRAGDAGDWSMELSNYNHTAEAYVDVDVSKYLGSTTSNTFQVWIGDTTPEDGWGGNLFAMSIINHQELGYQPVLNSQDIIEYDEHNEVNKGYYTIDLSPALTNNPAKEVFVQIGDASTSDGWGGAMFWMAAYSGDIVIQSDHRVFDGLKDTPAGEPTSTYGGIVLLDRQYALNPSKTLSSIVLPVKPTDSSTTSSLVYLLAATLSAPPPTLGIQLQTGNNVRLFWTTNAPGYSLQSTTNLLSPQWTTVTDGSAVVGDQITVTQPVAGTRFYRLAK